MRVARLIGIAAITALALSGAACGSKDSSGGIIAKAKNDKKLVIGVKSDQPGLSMRDGVQYSGYDIEIAKIIARGLGVSDAKIEWKTTVSANREPFIQQGNVDLVVATYSITDERKQKITFAGPYYTTGQDLLVRASDSSITSVDSIDGKKVCSVTGSTPAKRIHDEHSKAQLQLFDSYSKCVEALNSGSVDAVTTDDIILAGYAAQPQYAGKLKVVGKPFSSEPYGIGLKKGDVAGCQKINEILKAAVKDGSYTKAWDSTLGSSGKSAPQLDESKLTNCG